MSRKLAISLLLLASVACKKTETAAPPTPVDTAATQSVSTASPFADLPKGAPIPGQGVALWLIADDVKPAAGGKLASWSNPQVPIAVAIAEKLELQPAIVANAINGHAVVRFDGWQNMMQTNIDIGPGRMPEATIIAVFNSKTESPALRKLYGDDNGGYDRAVGLDNRGGDKNYVVFAGKGVTGYFNLKAHENYITSDQYTMATFNGWVNGAAVQKDVPAEWGDALPNLYIGGTGTVYNEPWMGDLAEIIVYARLLTEKERIQVEDYLAAKYLVVVAR
ncbi:MAG: hypothetical protein ACXW3E_10125 [Thermoanaerobaculia bacterium]